MTRIAVHVLAVALVAVACHAQDTLGIDGGNPPIGLQILSDPELFPRERDGDHAITRLERFGSLEAHQRNGRTTTSVMGGYAPTIDLVIQKYGEPDRVTEEPRELDVAPDRVYYWGDYGFAVRPWDEAREVSWVLLVLSS